MINDYRVLKNDVVGFTETQIKPWDSTCLINEVFKNYNMNYSNNENKFLRLAYGFWDNVFVLRDFSSNGISILSLRIDAFSDKTITLMLLYWAHSVSLEQFCEILEYLLISNLVAVIVGNLNFDLSKVSTNKILDHLKDYAQVVNEPTHIARSLIDHVYINNTLLKDFADNVKVQDIFLRSWCCLNYINKW